MMALNAAFSSYKMLFKSTQIGINNEASLASYFTRYRLILLCSLRTSLYNVVPAKRSSFTK